MQYLAAALWSINARLGTLCLQAGGALSGEDLTPLSYEWVLDMGQVAREESEAVRESLEEMEETYSRALEDL